MDVEAATAAADPSSNPFAPPFKASPATDPDQSPDGFHPSDGDRNNHHGNGEDPSVHDEDDGLAMDYHHHTRHNGHGTGDIMTSSFYGNGDGYDRDLFGMPTADLGPETHVDLLDDDGMLDVVDHAAEDYKSREFGVEAEVASDQLPMRLEAAYEAEEKGYLEAVGFAAPTTILDTSPLSPEEDEEDLLPPVEVQVEEEEPPVNYGNPFKSEGGWSLPQSEQKIEEEGYHAGVMQFEEEPSTRQHCDEDRRDHHVVEQEEVIQYKEEPAVEKEEVVPEEEGAEVGGGSGLEEAEDDSEEEGEWKYVSAKPTDGGAVVPEAVSPEAALPDETSCSPALPEQELLEQQDALSPALPPRVEAATPEAAEVEDLHTRAETCDLKAEGVVADDDKFCLDLGFEVVQKIHVVEVCEPGVADKPGKVDEPGLVDKPAEEETELVGVQREDFLQGGKSPIQIESETEDSMMESRLNPDAAEFVPVSPSHNVNAETFSGFGNDFDTFKKEAEKCPGEVSEVPAVASALMNMGLEDDSDTVLSSSFSHDVNSPSDVLQKEVDPHVQDIVTSANDFLNVDDDENKENISQEGEDKENMSQCITTSDVSSALNRSFEILEEQVSGNDQVSDFFGSTVNTSNVAKKDEPEMVCEQFGHDLMADLSPATKEPESILDPEVMEQSPKMVFETPELIQNINELSIDHHESEEVSNNQSSECMQPSHVEGVIQEQTVPGDSDSFFMKYEERVKNPFEMDLCSGIAPAGEIVEKKEMLDHGEIKDILEDISHIPNLQICPMRVEGLEEKIQTEIEKPMLGLSSQLELGQGDLLDKQHTTPLIDVGKQIETVTHEPEVDIPGEVEPSMESIQALEAEVAEFCAESFVKNTQEFQPVEVHSVAPPLEESQLSPTVPIGISELSFTREEQQGLSFEERVSSVEDKTKIIEDEIPASLNLASEMEVMQEIASQGVENTVCMSSLVMVSSPEHVEVLDVTKEQSAPEVTPPADMASSEPIVEVPPKEVVEESIPEDVSKAAAVGGAAVAVAAVAAAAGLATAATSDTKSVAKKPTAADKKQVPDKTKASSTATTKAKSSPKPPVTAARTTAPKRTTAPPTSKTAPIPAARTATAERKPATSAAKPAATSKPPPATTTSLSSKPKTAGTKPATATTTRIGTAPRASAAPSRPSTAGSTAPKSGMTTTTSSKPATSSPRPSTAPSRTTEPKKMVNGDASKSTAASALTKTSPRKPTTTSSTTASKPLGSTRVSLTARTAPSKTSAETTGAKAKPSPVAGTVNGAVPKTTTRTSTAPKPSAPAPARTKPATTTKTATAPTAPGIAKKAKESVNKHISATRLSGVTSTAQKSATAKTASPKGTAPASLKGMANGTPGKKAELNSNSKKVEEKVELLISPHENGIALDCNDIKKELDGVVGIEDGVHEAKEQMVLLGDALTIGEAV